MKDVTSISLAIVLSATGAWANTSNEEAVEQVVRLFVQDFNDGAFELAPTYTTDDWEHIHSGGGITSGRDAVLRDVRGVHQTILKGVSMSIDGMTTRFVTPDVAIVVATHTVSPHRSSNGAMHVNEEWLKTYVVVRNEHRWLLTLDHATTIEGSISDEPTAPAVPNSNDQPQ